MLHLFTLFVLIFARTNFRAISRKNAQVREIARKLVHKIARRKEVRENMIKKAFFGVKKAIFGPKKGKKSSVNRKCAKINPRENSLFSRTQGARN